MLVNREKYITYIVDSNSRLHFRGGPLSYKFRVTNVTFHFGTKDGNGSEHTIDGRHMDAEVVLFFVCVLTEYDSDVWKKT